MNVKQTLHQISHALSWKLFLGIFIPLFLSFLVVLHVIVHWAGEPSINHNYTFLCGLMLGLQAEVAALLISRRCFSRYVFCWCLPLAYMVAELVNGTCNTQNYVFASVFHYGFIGNCLLLVKWLLSECLPQKWQLKRRLVWMWLPLELGLMLVPLMVMVNRVLTGSGIDAMAVRAICQTNRQEAADYFFFQNHGVAILAILALLIPALIMAWRALDARPAGAVTPTGMSRIISYPVMAALGLVILAIGGQAGQMFSWIFPTRFWWLLHVPYDYRKTIRIYNEGLSARKKIMGELSEHLKVKEGYKGIYVVIVGESLDRNYMSAYGYARNTSPFQKELRQSPQGFFFEKPYSGHVLTMFAVPMMLTADNQYLSPAERKETKASVSLIDIANKLNMETYWISNQEKMSHFTCQISSLVSTAKTRMFLRDEPGAGEVFDHQILERLEKLSPFPESCVVFIHLAGSHFPYWKCYPKDFSFPEGLTEAYDKAVYYNDTVIRDIVTFFQKRQAAAIFYASDHSDGVSIGRVHDARKSRFIMEMAEIPAWVYLSDAYMKDNPDVAQTLRQACSLPFTNDLAFNLLLDIMKLKIDLFPEDHSPLHENYILKRRQPMTVNGTVKIPQE